MARKNTLKKGALDLSSIFPVDVTEDGKLVHLTNEVDGSVKVDNTALDTKVSDLETADSDEQARAEAAELALTNAISAEAQTARAAESANATAISAEAVTARAAEDANEVHIDKIVALSGVAKDSQNLGAMTLPGAGEEAILTATETVKTAIDKLSDKAMAEDKRLDNEIVRAGDAEGLLSGRLDTLEADPTTQTYVDAQITAALASEMTFKGSIDASDTVDIVSPDNGDVWVVSIGGAAGTHGLGGLDLEAGDMVVVQTKDNAGNLLVDVNDAPEPQYHLIQKNLTDFISKTESDDADAILQSNLDSVEAAALSARNTIQADVDANELYGDNDRAAIRSEFATADAAIQADVDANETARDTADGQLAADTQSVFSQLQSMVEALIRGDHYDAGRIVQDADTNVTGFVLADKQHDGSGWVASGDYVMDLGQSFYDKGFLFFIDGQQMDPILSGGIGEYLLGSWDSVNETFTAGSGMGGQYIKLCWQPQEDSVLAFSGVKQSHAISPSFSASYSSSSGHGSGMGSNVYMQSVPVSYDSPGQEVTLSMTQGDAQLIIDGSQLSGITVQTPGGGGYNFVILTANMTAGAYGLVLSSQGNPDWGFLGSADIIINQ